MIVECCANLTHYPSLDQLSVLISELGGTVSNIQRGCITVDEAVEQYVVDISTQSAELANATSRIAAQEQTIQVSGTVVARNGCGIGRDL